MGDGGWEMGDINMGTQAPYYPLPITHYPLPITSYPPPISHLPSPISHLSFPMLPLTPKFTICNDRLPLAVYREVAAHLQQIEGIVIGFLAPVDREFSYTQSQLGGLEITGADRLTPLDLVRLEQILSYYANRFEAWTFDRES